MKKKLILLAAALALSSVTSGESSAPSCNLEGTWFGGSADAKFLLTITQTPGGDYTISFGPAFSMADMGLVVATACNGSITKTPGKDYEVFAIVMANRTPGHPAPTVDVMGVHGFVRVIDCNTIRIDYDFYGGYLADSIWTLGKMPFLDIPDYVPNPPPFSETYRRMPTTCAQCPNQ